MEPVIVESTYAALAAHRVGHHDGFKAGVAFTLGAIMVVKAVRRDRTWRRVGWKVQRIEK